ncbi:hypothetical protein EJA72_24675 [Pseudomonas sp. PB120]|uniref:hypothetical protein n=1 Tax=Pseudomonas sp. PB120 TaxID=2494700 RepID=UPI0012FDD7C4|nr:hypothetical protein [Pseudomonas sp. PB120]MVV51410.1 hypothetical protein [Pseudomonas sp. PB120]
MSNVNGEIDCVLNDAQQDEYFNRIEVRLAEMPRRRRVKRAATLNKVLATPLSPEYDASVVGPSLVVFEQKLSDDDKQDALDSQAFAEAIVRNLPAGTSLKERYSAYNEALRAIGWVSESYTFKRYDSKQLTLTMNEALLQILQTVISVGTGNVLGLVASGLEKLKGDKEALKIVESGNTDTEVVSFKAVPCIVAPGGGMAMVTGGLDIVSKDYDGHFLFFTFKTDGLNIFQAAGVRKFNKRVFDRKRHLIYNYIDQFGDALFKKLTGK